MKKYDKVYSDNLPKHIEITPSAVFIASNITPCKQYFDAITIDGYCYDYIEYTKDEYIKLLGDENEKLNEELLNTQSALCDIYELLEGGLE